MADRTRSVDYSSPAPKTQAQSHSAWATKLELGDQTQRGRIAIGDNRLRGRRINDIAVIENPLAHLSDEDLIEDVRLFAGKCLPLIDSEKLLRAAKVAKDIKTYDTIARDPSPNAGAHLPVQLTDEEKTALRNERDVLFSENGMLLVIITVSLAAFLQGQVQSSINGATLYASQLRLQVSLEPNDSSSVPNTNGDFWRLGAANASPYLFAALVGCPLALPINDLVGRRGAMSVAALLILASSLGSVWVTRWYQLFAIRIINGVGMGVKAVSTPILASETAVGFWRGSSILVWQLWVAFGIMAGFAFNLIFMTAPSDHLRFQLMLGAPFVPALMLLAGLWFCPESPRYHMRPRSSNYNPAKAYRILEKLRNTELQALRDVYLVYKSIEQEDFFNRYYDPQAVYDIVSRSLVHRLFDYASQYKELFIQRRLRNALISSSTVALAQQLCGINILAFYSSTLFTRGGANPRTAMEYSLGFGAVNFFFGLPAIRTIDTLGRRKWLVLTLPIMCLFMTAAAASFSISNHRVSIGIVAMWLYLHAAAYSPGMGPIPFTLASESFPLSHREAGCAFAISVNLLFAGLLSFCFPSIINSMQNGGALGFFAGLNLLAFILVFLLVEETKKRSLEDLDWIFAVPKSIFVRYQVTTYLPWFVRHYLLGKRRLEKQNLYKDHIWGRGSPSPCGPHCDGSGDGMSLKDAHPVNGQPGSRNVPANLASEEGDGPLDPHPPSSDGDDRNHY